MNEAGYMLDTVVFNSVAKGRLAWVAGHKVFTTHVQRDELMRTGDPVIKERLLAAFNEVDPTSLPTDTAIWGDSRWDEAKWSSEDGMCERLLMRIVELDKASGKKPRDPLNPSRDARIAETAIKAGLTLVTDDANLAQTTTEQGGHVINLVEFGKREVG